MQTATSDKTFHLKWNNHLQNLSQLFTTIYSSSALADVTLSCRDGSIRAHKLVLSACSPYFEQIFKENPCKHPVIILKGISYSEINLLVEFMYKGSVDVQELDLQSLMHTASELEIRGLAYEVRKDASSLLNVNLNEYPNFPAPSNSVQDNAFVGGFDGGAPVCSSPYDSTPRTVNPYQTNLERLRQIHMYQQAMCRSNPYSAPQNQSEVSPKIKKRKTDEPMPATTTTAVKNILAAAAKELAEKKSNNASKTSACIQTEDDIEIVDMKLEREEMDDEEDIPLHGRDTRFKGKKRVSVGMPNDYVSTMPKNKQGVPETERSSNHGMLKCVDLENLRESRENAAPMLDENEDSSALDTSDDNNLIGERKFDNPAEQDEDYDSSDSKQEPNMKINKVFKCDLCDLSYGRKEHLVRHRRSHTGDRPYKCTSCAFSFNRSSHLARHRRTHTGERPYRCEACGRCFARGDKLKLHMRICEKDEYVLPGSSTAEESTKVVKKEESPQTMLPGMVSIGHSESHQLMFTPSGEVMLAPRTQTQTETRDIPRESNNASIVSDHSANQSLMEVASVRSIKNERLNYSDGGYPIKRGRGRPRKKPLPPVEPIKKRRGRPPKIIKIDPLDTARQIENYTSSNLPFGDFSYLTDIISTHFNQSTQQAYQNMLQMNPMLAANALSNALSTQAGLSSIMPQALQNLETLKAQAAIQSAALAKNIQQQNSTVSEPPHETKSINSSTPAMRPSTEVNVPINPASISEPNDHMPENESSSLEIPRSIANMNNCEEKALENFNKEKSEESKQKAVMIGDCQISMIGAVPSEETLNIMSNVANTITNIGDCTIQPVPQND